MELLFVAVSCCRHNQSSTSQDLASAVAFSCLQLSTRNAHCAAAATKLWWQCCSALVHLTLHTAVPVSAVCCLGTMTWGKQNTEAEAHEQLSYAWDYGINFMDTAGWSHIPLLHCPVSVGMAGLLPGGVGLKRISSVSS